MVSRCLEGRERVNGEWLSCRQYWRETVVGI